MKPHPLDDTSTATKTWKTEQHRTNIRVISSFLIHRIYRRFYVSKSPWSFHFHWKWKPKKSPLDDTSTAIKIWKTQPHRTNVGDIIIFDTRDVTKFLHFVFISKWKPRNLLSMIPAQPQKPERHNNTEQTSAISSFLINRMHHRFYVSKSPWSESATSLLLWVELLACQWHTLIQQRKPAKSWFFSQKNLHNKMVWRVNQ